MFQPFTERSVRFAAADRLNSNRGSCGTVEYTLITVDMQLHGLFLLLRFFEGVEDWSDRSTP
ncbi:hypothetical protein BofuT4_uP159070.1 [Botrytis cinerea T4]|uniref:Uncharacterized protein n=1 Tax=Botryotinia fuckeliana (strain T4) TaxID=999810 RepID=G2YTY8_BOTF4|nr:hypothetical protein BofuT4_uP159070.1 [Botrytis cinerea T4]